MLSNFEWFQSTVASLWDDSLRIQLLSDLKIAVNALNNNQLQLVSNSLPLGGIFDCLNSSEQEQVNLTSDVLSTLMSALVLGQILDEYSAQLMRSLAHPMVRVKEMVIKELLVGTVGEEEALRLSREEALLLNLVDCVSNEDVAVAKLATQMLAKMGKTAAGRSVIFVDPLLQRLKEAMAHDSIVRFRIYELGIEIACHSQAGLTAVLDSSLLLSLLTELAGHDVLLQLNSIDQLASLAVTEHGLRYLEGDGVIRSLVGKMASIDGDPLVSLLLPGLLKFFGSIAQKRPGEIFTQYPIVLETVFNTLDNPDPIVAGIAMDTIGYVATSVEGKLILNTQGEKMSGVFRRLDESIRLKTSECRVRALITVRDLLLLKPCDQDNRSLSVARGWFHQLSGQPVDLVMSVCKLPFPDLRLAGLEVLRTVADQPWGRVELVSTPGMLEFLTNRAVEPDKTCKEAKFAAVEAIVKAADAEAVLGAQKMQHMMEFLREGPFFTQVHTEVFIEHMSA